MTENALRAAHHEAGHCLMGWHLRIPVALVELDGIGGGKTRLDHEPVHPRDQWLISFAGPAAEAEFFLGANMSDPDKIHAGAPRTRSELRGWKAELQHWLDAEFANVAHLALRLTERLAWHPQHLAELVHGDDAFTPYRPLYAKLEVKPAAHRSISKPSVHRGAKPSGSLTELIRDVAASLQTGANVHCVSPGAFL